MTRITFTGDILCFEDQDKGCKQVDGSYDYSPIFERVKPLFEKSDFVIGSLETTCSGKDARYTHSDSSFNTPDELLIALKEAGVDMLTTANNHCLDRGEKGLLRTMEMIEESGLEYTGTRSSPDVPPYLIKCFEGIRVAFIAYSYGTNSDFNGVMIPKGKQYLVNLTRPQDAPIQRPRWKRVLLRLVPGFMLPRRKPGSIDDCVAESEIWSQRNDRYEQSMLSVINDAKQKSDIVILCLHSGGQFNSKVGPYTAHLFDIISSAGADVIVCNHAHRVLPIFKKNGCMIASALGNFTCDPGKGYWIDGVNAEYSILLNVDISKEKGLAIDFSFSVCKSADNGNGLSVVSPISLKENRIDELGQYTGNLDYYLNG